MILTEFNRFKLQFKDFCVDYNSEHILLNSFMGIWLNCKVLICTNCLNPRDAKDESIIPLNVLREKINENKHLV